MVDILVVGATGYSGKLITRYLAVHNRQSFSFAIAGRSDAKLKDLISSLRLPSSDSIESYTVDVRDTVSIEQLFKAARPRVVISAVGPFILHGLPLARACALAGIHYVDITGEGNFVFSLVNEVDYQATKSGAILIPCSGFDVVPFDILAYLSARTLAENLPKSVSTSDDVGVSESHSMWSVRGMGLSGGTLASILAMIESDGTTNSPNYADFLSPVPAPRPKWKLVYSFPAIARLHEFGGFSMFTPLNTAIVQRTRGLLTVFGQNGRSTDSEGEITPAYSSSFTYSDALRASNRVSAFFISFGFLASFTMLALFPPMRWLARRLGFSQGQGASDEVLEKGHFKGRNISVSSTIPGQSKPLVVESTMLGKGDPYLLTAVFAAETGLALLAPRESLPPIAQAGGVLTPMAALGTTLIHRLSASGRCEFESSVRG